MQTRETATQQSLAKSGPLDEHRVAAAGNAGVGIEVKNVSKYFRRTKSGEPQAALLNVSLSIRAGTFVCLVGPSGCGKSTLLNMIGGFLQADRGEIATGGRPIQAPGADRGMIFQEPTLFPWLSVRDNVLFGPKAQGGYS